MMNWERVQREVVVACFEVLFWHLPGGTAKNYENT
jgi:hypothetical protein